MSKTIKDQANYFKHHLERGDDNFVKKSKFKISPAAVPEELKPMVDKLNYSYNTALRHGNNRNMYAKAKVLDRRNQRNQDKAVLRMILKDE